MTFYQRLHASSMLYLVGFWLEKNLAKHFYFKEKLHECKFVIDINFLNQHQIDTQIYNRKTIKILARRRYSVEIVLCISVYCMFGYTFHFPIPEKVSLWLGAMKNSFNKNLSPLRTSLTKCFFSFFAKIILYGCV